MESCDADTRNVEAFAGIECGAPLAGLRNSICIVGTYKSDDGLPKSV